MSTGRVNLALLLNKRAPAAAVLEQLEGQTGPFDVMDAALPHRLHAEAQAQVQGEQAKAKAIAAYGDVAIGKLLSVVDRCLRSERAADRLPPKLRDANGEATVEAKGEGRYVLRRRGASIATLECPLPFLPLWVSSEETGMLVRKVKVRGVYEQLASGDLEGVRCRPGDPDPRPTDHQWLAPRS